MALSVDQIRILVKAETKQALKNLKGVHGQSQKVSMGFKDILKTGLGITGIMGAIRLVSGAVKKAIKTQMQFEQSIANVASVSGDSRKELALLARQMGRDTIYSATQSADAMYFLASAGLKVNDMAKILKPTLNLAAAAQMGIAEATDLVVNQLKIYQVEMDKAGEFTDFMAHTVASSNTNMTQLGSALSYTSSIAKRLNWEFSDLNVVIGGMADLGIKAERAGVQLRQAMVRLIKPSGEAKKVLEKYNITQRQVNEALHDPIKLFKLLRPITEDAADATALFGLRQQDVIGLIQKGIPNLERLKKGMEAAGGAAQRMADIQVDTLKGQLKLLNSAYEELILSFSKTGTLKELVKMLKNLVLWVGEVVNSFDIVAKAQNDYLYQSNKLVIATAKEIKGYEARIKAMKKEIEASRAVAFNKKRIISLEKKIEKARKGISRIAALNRKQMILDSMREALNTEKTINGENKKTKNFKKNIKEKKTTLDDYYAYVDNQYMIAYNKEHKQYGALMKLYSGNKEKQEEIHAQHLLNLEELDKIHADKKAVDAEAAEIQRMNYLGYKMETEMIAETQRYERLKEMAAQYNWDIEELETVHNIKLAAIAMKHFKEKSDMFLGSATSINNSLIKINKNRLDSIDKDDKKGRDRVIEELNRLWEWQRGLAMTQAGINAAAAVLKTMASVPFPLNVGLAAAQGIAGAVQIAAMASEKKPEYAMGTESAAAGMALVGERGPELVNFRGGEQVIPNNRISNYTTNAQRSIVIENVSLPNVTNTKEMLLEMQEIADSMGTSLLNV